MNCPVCFRNNAVTLSVCPTCGTMISDLARAADVVNKVHPIANSADVETKMNSAFSNPPSQPVKTANAPEAAAPRAVTASISTKLTSPTLIEFHTANAIVPEWRLQLQNTVRQRHERDQNASEKPAASPSRQPNLVTKGATALKIEPVEEIIDAETVPVGNPKLASALLRIKNSRQKFLVEEEEIAPAPVPVPAKANKNYPFYIAAKTNEADVKASVNSVVKPKLAGSMRAETKDLDTNKLPALPAAARTAASFEDIPAVSVPEEIKVEEKKKIEIEPVKTAEIVLAKEVEDEDDDCAPFAMRFNAGLFDLIIGSFLSLILLAPFILMSEGWSSTAGIFAFLATCAVVMFVYLTTTISMHGKTFGMRLFSLELVDIEGENYPTLHQAAVSSAVYLLSLAFGGIGFLTLLFNEEKRAVHDLVSGTIVVREF